jgi:hypothetical protein
MDEIDLATREIDGPSLLAPEPGPRPIDLAVVAVDQ